MPYSEIINEIQEQIDDVNAHVTTTNESIAEKQQELAELQLQLPKFEEQLVGLNTLKANAQQLVDGLQSVDINLNVNVNTTNAEGTSMVVASGSSIPQGGPFS